MSRTSRLLRANLIDLLGGKCVRCGFSDRRALQFDHKSGGIGHNRPTGWAYTKHLMNAAAEDQLQLLCANCNWIKRHESGGTELGGKATWGNVADLAYRLEVAVERLTDIEFGVPDNRTANSHASHRVLAPYVQWLLHTVDYPLTPTEIAYILESFGWTFGTGRVYTYPGITVRNAIKRRPDLFRRVDTFNWEVVPGAPLLLDSTWSCTYCGNIWIPKITPPVECSKCARRTGLQRGKAAGDHIQFPKPTAP